MSVTEVGGTPWELPGHIAELLDMGGGEVVQEILALFLQDVPGRVKRLATAIESGDAVMVSREGHSLKGGCGQVGAKRLAALAAEWEYGPADPARWRTLLAEFYAEFARVESMVRQHPTFNG